MSVEASSWAWKQDLPGNEKLVLLAVADAANDDGECWPGQTTLASKVGTSDRAVRENLARLEERGLIARAARRRSNGSRTSDLIRCRLRPEDSSGRPVDQPEAERRDNRKPTSGPEPSGEPEQLSSSAERAPEEEAAELHRLVQSSEMIRDVEELLLAKRKVDGRRVKAQEMVKAAAVLDEFNRQLGRDFGLGAHLTPIVMRVRDRPSWDAAKLQRLVQSACRVRWWEANGRSGRAPTPAVIFGNERVFEAVVQDAAAEAAGEPTAEVKRKRFVRDAPVERQGERRTL